MLTDTDLLNSEWEPTTTGENFPRITRLDKKLVSPKFKIRVTGNTKSEMLNNLEHLESVFDRDCFLNQMGRLYIGEFYRECFITGITHGKVFEKTHTVAEYVATSNDGYWVNNKQISFSGSGALVGEIADKMYVSASHRSQDIIYTPQADHTCHLEWNNNTFGDQWIRFDVGQVTNIGSFGEINLSSSGTPIDCEAQISSGEVVDDSRSVTVTTGDESTHIRVDDFTEVTIDSYGEVGWENPTLWVVGYSDELNSDRFAVSVGDTFDVSPYKYISFLVGYTTSGLTTTVDYTVPVEQWTTVETYSGNSTVVLEDIECSSIRLRGVFIGIINDDISVMSDEQAPVRNLLDLGYQLENVSEERTDIPDDVYVFWSINNTSLDGFVYFDDTNIELKSIVTGSAIEVTGTLQGFANNEWVDIADIEQNMDETYDDHYDRLRIKLLNDNEFDLSNFTIGVTTDAKVYNESYAPSNAIIEISGMPNNPSIMIGNNEYGANIELQANHKLIIDTKNKTVQDYNESTDDYENVFDKRIEDAFEKIETGESEVTWGGNAEIKITLEQARSIPKWN